MIPIRRSTSSSGAAAKPTRGGRTVQGDRGSADDGGQLRADLAPMGAAGKWQARPPPRKRGETATSERANAPSRRLLPVSCPRSANRPQSAQIVLQSVIESRSKLGTE